MADAADLLLAISTWLGVCIAILVLVGLLVWRVTKSERTRAINALEEGGAETFGYVSHGFWVGGKVRILRRVRAPLLRGEPVLPITQGKGPGVTLNFGGDSTWSGRAQPSEVSADWVQFGSTIEAYGIDVAKGDAIIIEDGKVWMPMHASWLLLLGLLGRFGHWQDKGRRPPTITRDTGSKQASVRASGAAIIEEQRHQHKGNRQRRGSLSRESRPGWITSGSWQKSNAPWGDRGDVRIDKGLSHRPLYGLTGTMHLPSSQARIGRGVSGKDRVFFTRHRRNRVDDLQEEAVGVRWLFWMAVGCLPSATGQVICLSDVQDVPIIPEVPSLADHPLFKESSNEHYPLRPPTRQVHFGRRDEGSDGDIATARFAGRGAFGSDTSPADYIPREPGQPTMTDVFDPCRPRAFEFGLCSKRLHTLSNFAAIVHAELLDVSVLSLREVGLTDTEVREIAGDNDGTYIARSSRWIRLETDGCTRFLRREDGQLLAAVLMRLPLSPYGYLFSCEESACRDMLCKSANALPQLLARTMWTIDDAFEHLDQEIRNNLRDAMVRFNQFLVQPAKSTRLYYKALFQLDKALDAAIRSKSQRDCVISMSLACVMITSPEFRSLVSQSARLLAEAWKGTILIDLNKGLVNIPTVMNFLAEFPIDIKQIIANIDTASAGICGIVEVSLAELMLICQRAALRSTMLETALDSRPLFIAVDDLSTVVHMG